MTEYLRCPACRGARKVPKLGGMIGECNTCSGKGQILLADKPKPVKIEPVLPEVDIINRVAECVPSSDDKFIELPVEQQTKVDGKKALYRRKKA